MNLPTQQHAKSINKDFVCAILLIVSNRRFIYENIRVLQVHRVAAVVGVREDAAATSR